jgi:hypothetical protein
MRKRQLHVVDVGYRATLEEQDDPVIWLCHALRSAGSELDVLLSGNAVLYGVRAQAVEPLAFGSRRQRQAPDLAGDLASLLAKQVACLYVEEDAGERGVDARALIDGLVPISRAKLPDLFGRYDRVHRW